MHTRVLKADGTSEYFKIEKLRRSLRRSGACPEEVNTIIATISEEIYDGIRTQEIYRRAFSLLRACGSPITARYSLRRALLGLGPSGFPFEKLLARIFTAEGYSTRTGIIMAGHCAEHEIDVAAFNATHSFVGEAKFHSRAGIKTDLQVAMYSYARLLDLRDQKICLESICAVTEFHLITNTKFTSAALRYGECVGLKMLSWDYPKQNNLHDLIQRNKCYPITVLSGITASQVATLIANDIIICQDIVKKPEILRLLHLTQPKEQHILQEATQVCGS